MKRVLVLGAGGSAAYNFIESLRMSPEQFYIVGSDVNPYHIQLSNCDQRYLLPELSDPTYLDSVNKLIKVEGIDLVHPQPDPVVANLVSHVGEISGKTMLPSSDTMRITQDKKLTYEALQESDVPVAETYTFSNEIELFEAMQRLKESGNGKVWVRAVRGAGSRAALPATNFRQAKSWIEYWQSNRGTGYSGFMVSEYLPGGDYAYGSVWKNGTLLSSVVRQRMMYLYGFLTPSGTSSTPSVAMTVRIPEVDRVAIRAIKAIDSKPHGIFCVDLKANHVGIPCVTEINAGRFFTTSLFYAHIAKRTGHLGCNLPYVYVKAALDEDLSLQNYDDYPSGLYWIRMVDMSYKIFDAAELEIKKVALDV